jgi:hypothetical protein
MLSQTSFIVVSHGESLPSCLQLFPDCRHKEVLATPFCGIIVGRLKQPFIMRRKSTAEPLETIEYASHAEAYATSGLLDALSLIETTCEVRQMPGASPKPETRLPGWMRASPLKFRASSVLMKAFGMAHANPAGPDARPRGMTLSEEDSLEDTIPMDTHMSIDCDADLIELPPVTERQVAGSSSLHCVVGASTLLFGGVIGSMNFEADSAASLQAHSESELSDTTSDKGRRHSEASKRGVKWPKQLQGSSTSNGAARSRESRSCEIPCPSPTTNTGAFEFSSHASLGHSKLERPENVEASTFAPNSTEEVRMRAKFDGLFADDSGGSMSSKFVVAHSPRSPTATTAGSEQSKKFSKVRLSFTRNGMATVVPLFDDNPQAEEFTPVTPAAGVINEAASPHQGSAPDSGFRIPSNGSTDSAGQSINLSNVTGNSLFKRRRPRGGTEG